MQYERAELLDFGKSDSLTSQVIARSNSQSRTKYQNNLASETKEKGAAKQISWAVLFLCGKMLSRFDVWGPVTVYEKTYDKNASNTLTNRPIPDIESQLIRRKFPESVCCSTNIWQLAPVSWLGCHVALLTLSARYGGWVQTISCQHI